MANKKPIVLNSGQPEQLQSGDKIAMSDIESGFATTSALNDLTPISYLANTMTVNYGTLDTGNVSSLTDIDGTDVNISEASGTNPLQVTFDFVAVARMTTFAFYGHYSGGASHILNVEIYNVSTTNWDILGTIGTETAKSWHVFPIYHTTSYINAGAVSVRIRHLGTGVNTHDLILDHLEVNYGGASGGQSNLTASQIVNVPSGNISANNLQSAINELDSEKGTGDMVLASAQSVTGAKTFDKDKLLVKGTSTGKTNITTANTSATDYTATLPAKDGTIAMISDITDSVPNEKIITDFRKNNYQLANAFNLVYANENSETVTLSTGNNYIHGFIFAKDKLFASTDTNPAAVIRFNNPSDLTNYQVLALTGYTQANDLVYSRSKNRLYVTVENATALQIIEIDPDHANWDTFTVVVNDNTRKVTYRNSICTDETYLYVTSYDGDVYKINMSTWAITTTAMPHANNHAIRYDGTYLYTTCLLSPGTPGVLIKIRPSDMTVLDHIHFPTGLDGPTDDFAFAGDYIWIGFENESNPYVLKVKKSDLTYEKVDLGEAGVCYCMFFDGTDIWANNVTTSKLYRVDPQTHEVREYSLGLTTPNELVSDGQRVFITDWTAPAKVMRTMLPRSTKKKKVYHPASTGRPAITNGCSNLTVSENSNNILQTFDFDATTAETCSFDIMLPADYTFGTTVDVKIYWTCSSSSSPTDYVRWLVKNRVCYNGDGLGITDSGTGVKATNTGSYKLNISTVTITLDGTPYRGSLVRLNITRDATHTDDTLAVDARLIGVGIDYL